MKSVILSINRFEEKKNIGLAIHAFSEFISKKPAQYKKCLLVITGGFDPRVPENIRVLSKLETLATSLHLSYQTMLPNSTNEKLEDEVDVLFLASFNENQRSYLFSRAHCLLYTPSLEHFGIVPVEAMYKSIPVIAVNSGGPVESIVDKVTGYLCDATTEKFSDAICLVFSDKQRHKIMGKNGRQRVINLFSMDTFINSLENIALELTNNASRVEGIWTWRWTVVVFLVTPLFLYFL